MRKGIICAFISLVTVACGPGDPLPVTEPSRADASPETDRALEPTATNAEAEPSPIPTPSKRAPTEIPPPGGQWGPSSPIELNEEVDMVPGDVVALAGTGVEIMLVEARGPGPDCYDCPNTARLIVRSNGQTRDLKYSFSGNMLLELLQKAKRKEAFGYVLIAERIDDDSFTLRVELNSSQE